MQKKLTIMDGPYTAQELRDGRGEDYGQFVIKWSPEDQYYFLQGSFVPHHPFIPCTFRSPNLTTVRRVARHIIRGECFPGDLPQANLFPCHECGITVTDVPSARPLYPHRRGCQLAY